MARAYGVSQGWISRLVTRYRAEGEAAFQPLSRRPKTSPKAVDPDTVERVRSISAASFSLDFRSFPCRDGRGHLAVLGPEATEVVRGKVVLVDGTLTHCWSYAQHPELWNGKHKTTGFNAQLISLLDGAAVWISDPLLGKTHDAKSFTDTEAAQIVEKSGGGFSDKGYQGTGLVTPRRTRKVES